MIAPVELVILLVREILTLPSLLVTACWVLDQTFFKLYKAQTVGSNIMDCI